MAVRLIIMLYLVMQKYIVKGLFSALVATLLFLRHCPVYAQTQERSSSEIVRLSWKASNEGDLKTLSDLVDEIIKTYGDKAKALASQLSSFPCRQPKR